MKWLSKLKVAIIERDTQLLDNLLDEVPQLNDPREIQTALYLIEEAKKMIIELQNETKISMKKIQQNLKFLNATTLQKEARFDKHF